LTSKLWSVKGTGFRGCENLPVQNSVPKGRLRVAQDEILGILTNSARSSRTQDWGLLAPEVLLSCGADFFRSLFDRAVNEPLTLGLDIDKLARRSLPSLWRTPVVDVRDLVHAGNSAMRSAALFRQVLPLEVGFGVLRQRNARIPALL
jgi:hypothetical protein